MIAGLKWLSGHLKSPPVSFTALKRSLSEESGSWGTTNGIVIVIGQLKPFMVGNELVPLLHHLKLQTAEFMRVFFYIPTPPEIAKSIGSPLFDGLF